MTDTQVIKNVYAEIVKRASVVGVELAEDELAIIVEKTSASEEGLAVLEAVFSHLAHKQHEASIKTLLRLSRLPQRTPKTFDSFDFARIQGKDAEALRSLPTLSNLYARRNIAFIGPGGIGKTHLAQAYGYACCMAGYKSYYIKANELNERLNKALKTGYSSRITSTFVKPACLIIDEVGRCVFDRAATELFFDIVDRRYEKEVPNTLIITSNTPVVNWDRFFTGTDTLACALDRIFDKASVYLMQGTSYRGAECDTYTVETTPRAIKLSR